MIIAVGRKRRDFIQRHLQLDAMKVYSVFLGLYTPEFYKGQSLVPSAPFDMKGFSTCQKGVSYGKPLRIIRVWLDFYLTVVAPGPRDDSNYSNRRKAIL